MAKAVIGSMRQKRLIEGDENLLEANEILIKEADDFPFVLKERCADGSIKTSVVISIDDYIKNLEEAYKQGLENGGVKNETQTGEEIS